MNKKTKVLATTILATGLIVSGCGTSNSTYAKKQCEEKNGQITKLADDGQRCDYNSGGRSSSMWYFMGNGYNSQNDYNKAVSNHKASVKSNNSGVKSQKGSSIGGGGRSSGGGS